MKEPLARDATRLSRCLTLHSTIMSEYQLTQGACQMFTDAPLSSEDPSNPIFDSNPRVQILSIKKVTPGGPNPVERHRVIISDGVHFVQGMLAAQLNSLVLEGLAVKNSVVNLTKWAVNTLTTQQQNKR